MADIDFGILPLSDMSPEREALNAAQEMVYDAWEVSTPEESIALAQKALKTSPFCVDAYNLLAEHVSTYNEALELYQKAAIIGEHLLGEDFFHEYMGVFWGVLDARPYMRAQAGIVMCLQVLGDQKGAVRHCKKMLKLSTNDNLGMRYILLPLLLETGKDKQAESLYKRYKDDYSAAWFYARALLDFRRYGASDNADATLLLAFALNKFVPDYLTQKKKLPARLPLSYSLGGKDEAVIFSKDNLAAWLASEGAIQWLDKSWIKCKDTRHPSGKRAIQWLDKSWIKYKAEN